MVMVIGHIAAEHVETWEKLVTALTYSYNCEADHRIGRPHTPAVYVVCAGSEHHEFIKLFPFWNENIDVQEITCKVAISLLTCIYNMPLLYYCH